MNQIPTMVSRVDAYLAERRRLGFELKIAATMLHSFARFADQSGHTGPLTTRLVIDWAKGQSRNASPFSWARRLELLRPLAKYLRRLDPATEFPATPIFGKAHRRLTPHIYTDGEIVDLLAAASRLQPAGTLRPATYETLFGLIAATGLRVSEALNLRYSDVDVANQCLTIRMTKFRKSRYVPFHSTVADALKRYLSVRDRYSARAADAPFFLSRSGRAPSNRQVHWTFQRLRQELGLIARGTHGAVRIHDLRHTFICRRVQRWQAEGADIDNAIAALATYVGHVKISDTYWYLTGIPDLMAAAGKRFEDFTIEGTRHERL